MAPQLTFVGDVFLPNSYPVHGRMPGAIVANLEYTIVPGIHPWPGKINLRAESQFLRDTLGPDILAVCLANNHTLDFGEDGLRATMDALHAAGIAFFGAGPLAERCGNPLVLPVGDHRIGLCGYVASDTHPVYATSSNFGVAPIDVDLIGRDIATARSEGASHVFVHLHWGDEEVPFPRPEDRATAHYIASMAPAAIIGHHPHCVQPFEVVEGVPIFYSIGNFIFPHLDLPATFDAQGTATERFRKHQEYWNRRGLVVTVDLADNRYSLARSAFDGRECAVAAPYTSFIPAADTPRVLALPRLKFRVAYAFGELRKKVYTAMRRRTRPQWRHLASLWRILRGAILPAPRSQSKGT